MATDSDAQTNVTSEQQDEQHIKMELVCPFAQCDSGHRFDSELSLVEHVCGCHKNVSLYSCANCKFESAYKRTMDEHIITKHALFRSAQYLQVNKERVARVTEEVGQLALRKAPIASSDAKNSEFPLNSTDNSSNSQSPLPPPLLPATLSPSDLSKTQSTSEPDNVPILSTLPPLSPISLPVFPSNLTIQSNDSTDKLPNLLISPPISASHETLQFSDSVDKFPMCSPLHLSSPDSMRCYIGSSFSPSQQSSCESTTSSNSHAILSENLASLAMFSFRLLKPSTALPFKLKVVQYKTIQFDSSGSNDDCIEINVKGLSCMKCLRELKTEWAIKMLEKCAITNRLQKLEHHQRNQHQMDTFQCFAPGCTSSYFKEISTLNEHLQNHCKSDVCRCTICDTDCSNYDGLTHHMALFHQKGWFGCLQVGCNKERLNRKFELSTFKTIADVLLHHIQEHNLKQAQLSSEQKQFLCQYGGVYAGEMGREKNTVPPGKEKSNAISSTSSSSGSITPKHDEGSFVPVFEFNHTPKEQSNQSAKPTTATATLTTTITEVVESSEDVSSDGQPDSVSISEAAIVANTRDEVSPAAVDNTPKAPPKPSQEIKVVKVVPKRLVSLSDNSMFKIKIWNNEAQMFVPKEDITAGRIKDLPTKQCPSSRAILTATDTNSPAPAQVSNSQMMVPVKPATDNQHENTTKPAADSSSDTPSNAEAKHKGMIEIKHNSGADGKTEISVRNISFLTEISGLTINQVTHILTREAERANAEAANAKTAKIVALPSKPRQKIQVLPSADTPDASTAQPAKQPATETHKHKALPDPPEIQFAFEQTESGIKKITRINEKALPANPSTATANPIPKSTVSSTKKTALADLNACNLFDFKATKNLRTYTRTRKTPANPKSNGSSALKVSSAANTATTSVVATSAQSILRNLLIVGQSTCSLDSNSNSPPCAVTSVVHTAANAKSTDLSPAKSAILRNPIPAENNTDDDSNKSTETLNVPPNLSDDQSTGGTSATAQTSQPTVLTESQLSDALSAPGSPTNSADVNESFYQAIPNPDVPTRVTIRKLNSTSPPAAQKSTKKSKQLQAAAKKEEKQCTEEVIDIDGFLFYSQSNPFYSEATPIGKVSYPLTTRYLRKAVAENPQGEFLLKAVQFTGPADFLKPSARNSQQSNVQSRIASKAPSTSSKSVQTNHAKTALNISEKSTGISTNCNLLDSSSDEETPVQRSPLPCHFEDCNVRCRTSDELLSHIADEHDVTLRFDCTQPQCTFESDENEAIRDHLKTVHNVEGQEQNESIRMFASPLTTELQNTLFENNLMLASLDDSSDDGEIDTRSIITISDSPSYLDDDADSPVFGKLVIDVDDDDDEWQPDNAEPSDSSSDDEPLTEGQNARSVVQAVPTAAIPSTPSTLSGGQSLLLRPTLASSSSSTSILAVSKAAVTPISQSISLLASTASQSATRPTASSKHRRKQDLRATAPSNRQSNSLLTPVSSTASTLGSWRKSTATQSTCGSSLLVPAAQLASTPLNRLNAFVSQTEFVYQSNTTAENAFDTAGAASSLIPEPSFPPSLPFTSTQHPVVQCSLPTAQSSLYPPSISFASMFQSNEPTAARTQQFNDNAFAPTTTNLAAPISQTLSLSQSGSMEPSQSNLMAAPNASATQQAFNQSLASSSLYGPVCMPTMPGNANQVPIVPISQSDASTLPMLIPHSVPFNSLLCNPFPPNGATVSPIFQMTANSALDAVGQQPGLVMLQTNQMPFFLLPNGQAVPVMPNSFAQPTQRPLPLQQSMTPASGVHSSSQPPPPATLPSTFVAATEAATGDEVQMTDPAHEHSSIRNSVQIRTPSACGVKRRLEYGSTQSPTKRLATPIVPAQSTSQPNEASFASQTSENRQAARVAIKTEPISPPIINIQRPNQNIEKVAEIIGLKLYICKLCTSEQHWEYSLKGMRHHVSAHFAARNQSLSPAEMQQFFYFDVELMKAIQQSLNEENARKQTWRCKATKNRKVCNFETPDQEKMRSHLKIWHNEHGFTKMETTDFIKMSSMYYTLVSRYRFSGVGFEREKNMYTQETTFRHQSICIT